MTGIETGEKPNIVYGRLLESAHISGYGFERVCSELEWLLDEDRWRQVGSGFEDFGSFLKTIDLSPFRMDADQRKALVRKMSAVEEASNRAIAKAVGVDERTIRRDAAADAAPTASDTPAEQVVVEVTAADAAPEWFDRTPDQVAGSQKARVDRIKRDEDAEQRRVEQAREEAEAQPEV